MSESSYKLISSQRQPIQRRRKPVRKVVKGHKLIEMSNKIFQVPVRQQRPLQKKAVPKPTKDNPGIMTSAVPKKQRRVTAPANSRSNLNQPPTVIHSRPKPPAPASAVKGKIPPWQPHTNTKHTSTKIVKVHRPLPKKGVTRRSKGKPMERTLLYILRLLIVGVGIGAIVGTVLSVLDPASRVNPNTTTPGQVQPQSIPTNPTNGVNLSQEIVPLKGVVQNLAAQYPGLTPGVFLLDLDNNNYIDVNATTVFSAASTIKLPILIAFFQDVDAGKISLDQMLVMSKQMVAGGSGNMQYKPVGTKFPALETVTNMITISDNTATNMVIAQLGGIEALNQRFRSWGLTNTAIRNLLPDLQGTNTTSPKELASLMAMVNKGNFVSSSSRDRILDIMGRTTRKDLLSSGLEPGATIADKTGDIGTVLADAGMVTLPTGKHYVTAVMVQRPYNDTRAQKLISSISRAIYQQMIQNIPSTLPSTGYQQPIVNPATGGYQPPVIVPPVGGDVTNATPMTGYQAPMIAPPIGNTTPMTGYQPPVIAPPMGNTTPMTGYQPPITPQYYDQQQR